MDGAMEEAFAVKHLVGADADAVGAEAALLTSVAYQNPSKVLVRTPHADVHPHVKVAGFGQPAISATVATNPCIWYAPEVWSGRRPSAPRRRTCTTLRC